jgi:uncharacterized protein YdeI (BOF family)
VLTGERLILIGGTLTLAAAFTMAPASAQTRIGDLQGAGVTIEGQVADIFGNKFVLEDGSGRVLVESGPPWHHQLSIRRGESVSVTGRLDGDTFDAYTIRAADGRVQVIRPAFGPPPWAGGPNRRN